MRLNGREQLTHEEHRQRHVELHRALDELFADYVDHHPERRSGFLNLTIRELLEWAHKQAVEPDER